MPRDAGRRRPRRRPAGPTLGFPQEQLAGEERRSLAAVGEGRPEVALCQCRARPDVVVLDAGRQARR
jgi:hypothetical protein